MNELVVVENKEYLSHCSREGEKTEEGKTRNSQALQDTARTVFLSLERF